MENNPNRGRGILPENIPANPTINLPTYARMQSSIDVGRVIDAEGALRRQSSVPHDRRRAPFSPLFFRPVSNERFDSMEGVRYNSDESGGQRLFAFRSQHSASSGASETFQSVDTDATGAASLNAKRFIKQDINSGDPTKTAVAIVIFNAKDDEIKVAVQNLKEDLAKRGIPEANVLVAPHLQEGRVLKREASEILKADDEEVGKFLVSESRREVVDHFKKMNPANVQNVEVHVVGHGSMATISDQTSLMVGMQDGNPLSAAFVGKVAGVTGADIATPDTKSVSFHSHICNEPGEKTLNPYLYRTTQEALKGQKEYSDTPLGPTDKLGMRVNPSKSALSGDISSLASDVFAEKAVQKFGIEYEFKTAAEVPMGLVFPRGSGYNDFRALEEQYVLVLKPGDHKVELDEDRRLSYDEYKKAIELDTRDLNEKGYSHVVFVQKRNYKDVLFGNDQLSDAEILNRMYSIVDGVDSAVSQSGVIDMNQVRQNIIKLANFGKDLEIIKREILYLDDALKLDGRLMVAYEEMNILKQKGEDISKHKVTIEEMIGLSSSKEVLEQRRLTMEDESINMRLNVLDDVILTLKEKQSVVLKNQEALENPKKMGIYSRVDLSFELSSIERIVVETDGKIGNLATIIGTWKELATKSKKIIDNLKDYKERLDAGDKDIFNEKELKTMKVKNEAQLEDRIAKMQAGLDKRETEIFDKNNELEYLRIKKEFFKNKSALKLVSREYNDGKGSLDITEGGMKLKESLLKFLEKDLAREAEIANKAVQAIKKDFEEVQTKKHDLEVELRRLKDAPVDMSKVSKETRDFLDSIDSAHVTRVREAIAERVTEVNQKIEQTMNNLEKKAKIVESSGYDDEKIDKMLDDFEKVQDDLNAIKDANKRVKDRNSAISPSEIGEEEFALSKHTYCTVSRKKRSVANETAQLKDDSFNQTRIVERHKRDAKCDGVEVDKPNKRVQIMDDDIETRLRLQNDLDIADDIKNHIPLDKRMPVDADSIEIYRNLKELDTAREKILFDDNDGSDIKKVVPVQDFVEDSDEVKIKQINDVEDSSDVRRSSSYGTFMQASGLVQRLRGMTNIIRNSKDENGNINQEAVAYGFMSAFADNIADEFVTLVSRHLAGHGTLASTRIGNAVGTVVSAGLQANNFAKLVMAESAIMQNSKTNKYIKERSHVKISMAAADFAIGTALNAIAIGFPLAAPIGLIYSVAMEAVNMLMKRVYEAYEQAGKYHDRSRGALTDQEAREIIDSIFKGGHIPAQIERDVYAMEAYQKILDNMEAFAKKNQYKALVAEVPRLRVKFQDSSEIEYKKGYTVGGGGRYSMRGGTSCFAKINHLGERIGSHEEDYTGEFPTKAYFPKNVTDRSSIPDISRLTQPTDKSKILCGSNTKNAKVIESSKGWESQSLDQVAINDACKRVGARAPCYVEKISSSDGFGNNEQHLCGLYYGSERIAGQKVQVFGGRARKDLLSIFDPGKKQNDELKNQCENVVAVVGTGKEEDPVVYSGVEDLTLRGNDKDHVFLNKRIQNIHTGGGDDQVVMSDVKLFGRSTINTGSGNDRVAINKGHLMDDSTIHTGSGNDQVVMGDVKLFGRSAIHTGSGNDQVVMGDGRMENGASIDGGDGEDVVFLGNGAPNYNEEGQIKGFEHLIGSKGANMIVPSRDMKSVDLSSGGNDVLFLSQVNPNYPEIGINVVNYNPNPKTEVLYKDFVKMNLTEQEQVRSSGTRVVCSINELEEREKTITNDRVNGKLKNSGDYSTLELETTESSISTSEPNSILGDDEIVQNEWNALDEKWESFKNGTSIEGENKKQQVGEDVASSTKEYDFESVWKDIQLTLDLGHNDIIFPFQRDVSDLSLFAKGNEKYVNMKIGFSDECDGKGILKPFKREVPCSMLNNEHSLYLRDPSTKSDVMFLYNSTGIDSKENGSAGGDKAVSPKPFAVVFINPQVPSRVGGRYNGIPCFIGTKIPHLGLISLNPAEQRYLSKGQTSMEVQLGNGSTVQCSPNKHSIFMQKSGTSKIILTDNNDPKEMPNRIILPGKLSNVKDLSYNTKNRTLMITVTDENGLDSKTEIINYIHERSKINFEFENGVRLNLEKLKNPSHLPANGSSSANETNASDDIRQFDSIGLQIPFSIIPNKLSSGGRDLDSVVKFLNEQAHTDLDVDVKSLVLNSKNEILYSKYSGEGLFTDGLPIEQQSLGDSNSCRVAFGINPKDAQVISMDVPCDITIVYDKFNRGRLASDVIDITAIERNLNAIVVPTCITKEDESGVSYVTMEVTPKNATNETMDKHFFTIKVVDMNKDYGNKSATELFYIRGEESYFRVSNREIESEKLPSTDWFKKLEESKSAIRFGLLAKRSDIDNYHHPIYFYDKQSDSYSEEFSLSPNDPHGRRWMWSLSNIAEAIAKEDISAAGLNVAYDDIKSFKEEALNCKSAEELKTFLLNNSIVGGKSAISKFALLDAKSYFNMRYAYLQFLDDLKGLNLYQQYDDILRSEFYLHKLKDRECLALDSYKINPMLFIPTGKVAFLNAEDVNKTTYFVPQALDGVYPVKVNENDTILVIPSKSGESYIYIKDGLKENVTFNYKVTPSKFVENDEIMSVSYLLNNTKKLVEDGVVTKKLIRKARDIASSLELDDSDLLDKNNFALSNSTLNGTDSESYSVPIENAVPLEALERIEQLPKNPDITLSDDLANAMQKASDESVINYQISKNAKGIQAFNIPLHSTSVEVHNDKETGVICIDAERNDGTSVKILIERECNDKCDDIILLLNDADLVLQKERNILVSKDGQNVQVQEENATPPLSTSDATTSRSVIGGATVAGAFVAGGAAAVAGYAIRKYKHRHNIQGALENEVELGLINANERTAMPVANRMGYGVIDGAKLAAGVAMPLILPLADATTNIANTVKDGMLSAVSVIKDDLEYGSQLFAYTKEQIQNAYEEGIDGAINSIVNKASEGSEKVINQHLLSLETNEQGVSLMPSELNFPAKILTSSMASSLIDDIAGQIPSNGICGFSRKEATAIVKETLEFLVSYYGLGFPVTELAVMTKILQYDPEVITSAFPKSYREFVEGKLKLGVSILSRLSPLQHNGSIVQTIYDSLGLYVVNLMGKEFYDSVKQKLFGIGPSKYVKELPNIMDRALGMLTEKTGRSVLTTSGALEMIGWCEEQVLDKRVPPEFLPSMAWILEMKKIKQLMPYLDSFELRKMAMEMFKDGLPIKGDDLEVARKKNMLFMAKECGKFNAKSSEEVQMLANFFIKIRYNNEDNVLPIIERENCLSLLQGAHQKERELAWNIGESRSSSSPEEMLQKQQELMEIKEKKQFLSLLYGINQKQRELNEMEVSGGEDADKYRVILEEMKQFVFSLNKMKEANPKLTAVEESATSINGDKLAQTIEKKQFLSLLYGINQKQRELDGAKEKKQFLSLLHNINQKQKELNEIRAQHKNVAKKYKLVPSYMSNMSETNKLRSMLNKMKEANPKLTAVEKNVAGMRESRLVNVIKEQDDYIKGGEGQNISLFAQLTKGILSSLFLSSRVFSMEEKFDKNISPEEFASLKALHHRRVFAVLDFMEENSVGFAEQEIKTMFAYEQKLLAGKYTKQESDAYYALLEEGHKKALLALEKRHLNLNKSRVSSPANLGNPASVRPCIDPKNHAPLSEKLRDGDLAKDLAKNEKKVLRKREVATVKNRSSRHWFPL